MDARFVLMLFNKDSSIQLHTGATTSALYRYLIDTIDDLGQNYTHYAICELALQPIDAEFTSLRRLYNEQTGTI